MNKTEPYFDENGTLIVPFECSDHTHKYWKREGKSMAEILADMGVDEKTWSKYTHEKYPGKAGNGTKEG